uniref:Sodium/hydrogen exchanger n=1 Tax=Poecilia latipinna TaxID=48699 RepID=A0A3B3UGL3_9TELE
MERCTLSRMRTNSGVICMIFVLFLCCTTGKCKLEETKPTNSVSLDTVKPHPNDIGEPQPYPEEEQGKLPVFTMNYSRIQIPFEFTLWVLLASFSKIGFHIYQKITIWIPESCLLIGIGLIVGGIMYSVKEEPPAVLSSDVFFLYMLLPIVLDNGYFMPTRPFFENVGTVLWYAVVGALWNSIGIGLSLFAICQFEVFDLQDINLQENLLFASIISAVDPVAVLNVFEDVGVNEQIYIVIFGEGLFSDAVTVVLYSMFAFLANMPAIDSIDVFLGVARFFVVGIGGVLFGLLFGFMAAFTSRFTSRVQEIEPLFVFMFSYLAYLVAELFAISSVMAIIICAITMKYYVEENVSQRSCTTIRHVVKMLATISETLIFFFLGVVTITTVHEWNWAYILFTLLFAFLWRGLGILVLTQIINPFRTIQFNLKDQFGLAYGGLRGAICFALVFTLGDTINRRNLFVTASVAIIIFTSFAKVFIRRTNKDLNTINVEIHTRTMEHLLCGIDDLCGQWGHYTGKTSRDSFKMFNDRFLRRILLRDRKAESSIVSMYKKLELQNAIELLDTTMGDISAAPSLLSLQDEKKEASRPKKKFKATDIRKMHDILSKNMYRIRQRTTAFTSKYSLPDDSQTREILIRRHASIRRSLRAENFPCKFSHLLIICLPLAIPEVDRLRSSGVSPRSSSRSLIPMSKLNTIEEKRSPVEASVASTHPLEPSSTEDHLDEVFTGSRVRGRRAPVPAARRRGQNRVDEDEDENISESQGEERHLPPRGWAPENRDLGANEAGNSLLRPSSLRSQRSWRT